MTISFFYSQLNGMPYRLPFSELSLTGPKQRTPGSVFWIQTPYLILHIVDGHPSVLFWVFGVFLALRLLVSLQYWNQQPRMVHRFVCSPENKVIGPGSEIYHQGVTEGGFCP